MLQIHEAVIHESQMAPLIVTRCAVAVADGGPRRLPAYVLRFSLDVGPVVVFACQGAQGI
jgi:hypothetical protein